MDLDFTFLKKTPPHSLDAEKAVLGGILVDNGKLNVVLSVIVPDGAIAFGSRSQSSRILTKRVQGQAAG